MARQLFVTKCQSAIVLGVIVSICLIHSSKAEAGTFLKKANLQQTLNSVLKARTDTQKAYVKRVTELVNQGKLPLQIVDSSYLWIRKKATTRARKIYPIIYFQEVLRLRAKGLGIDTKALGLDDFKLNERD